MYSLAPIAMDQQDLFAMLTFIQILGMISLAADVSYTSFITKDYMKGTKIALMGGYLKGLMKEIEGFFFDDLLQSFFQRKLII